MPSIQKNNIPVVILCGGRGTRIKEETEIIPKPLVKIGDKPILWHIMKIYNEYGFRNFILPVGYKGEKIKEYFLNYSALQRDFTLDFTRGKKRVVPHTRTEEEWKITIVDTGLDTQTGARIKRVAPYIKGDTFLMTYGDGVANVNIDNLLELHHAQKKVATITGVHPPARFGEIEVKGTLAVNFREKPQLNQGYINGGFLALNRGIFKFLNDNPDLNFEKDVLPVVARQRQLGVFRHDEFWQCMDTVRDMEHLNEIWTTGNIPWKVWKT